MNPPPADSASHHCSQCGAPLERETRGLCPACLARSVLEEPASEGALRGLPTVEELDAMLDGIAVEELIGRGGMGAVFRGRQLSLDRPVAIKLLVAPDQVDPQFTERFRLEAQTLARLQHPNIVTVFEHGEIEDFFYIVMEFVDGPELTELIARQALSPDESCELVLQLCHALQDAHDQGVVHRDLKPANILVDPAGRPRLADFGLAKILGGEEAVLLTGGLQWLGTPFYMAPEQRTTGAAVDHRADLFSLGVIFYELLTGAVPGGRFDPPSKSTRQAVPARLDPVVLKALESDPDRRYQSAAEFARALESARTARIPRRSLAAIVAALVIVAAAFWFFFLRNGSAPPTATTVPGSTPRPPAVEVVEGTGVLLDDRFDNGKIRSNDAAGWTVQQVGKAIGLDSGKGVRWLTGGGRYGFAALRCHNAFVVPDEGSLTVTWELSELKSERVGSWSYCVQLSVLPVSVPATDQGILVHLYDCAAPTISIRLEIQSEYQGVDFILRYKDGSGEGPHAAGAGGARLTHTSRLEQWNDLNGGRHKVWLRLDQKGITTGWSGGPEVFSATWEETSFDPPSPAALGKAVWPLVFAQNSDSDISGSHLLHRVTVEASQP